MSSTGATPQRHHGFNRIGGWLPQNPDLLVDWLRKLVAELDGRRKRAPLTRQVQELKELIESTAELRMLASAMFDEVPEKEPYNEDPIGNKQVRSYQHMLELFNVVMTEKAPIWSEQEYGVGLIGFPFNAILDWPMGTASGYAFFLKAEVNAKFKAILDGWRDDFLTTERSRQVINDGEDGWLSSESLATIERDTNVGTGQDWMTFQELFECDPEGDPEHWGFKSWDDFFVRRFRNFDTIRPVAYPDRPEWIVSSCESKPFALQTNVRDYDSFWLKGQPYSVLEVMGHDERAGQFVGGTVYQAFLSATSYHRWNAPVGGKVVASRVIDGTYFSEPTVTGFTHPDGPDPAAPDRAQGYITHVATRALFYIQAPEPVGLMAVVFVGMADVSTCQILPDFAPSKLPADVRKGDELGMFHHGGSTHCLLFRPGVKLAFVAEASPGAHDKNIPVRGELAYAYQG
ncbi:hypothetical protein CDD83_983 [Cordyceps sp. RAO-2017]|nr:hypothetical protein CDD83_983 [Cordyceps sp. RAO-2017]